MDGLVISENAVTGYKGTDESVIIPDGITCIWLNAFYRNQTVKKIFIPKSVTEVKEDAFYGCSNLTIYCEGEPTADWINKYVTVVEYSYSDEDDAFNFHRSSGSWSSHRTERKVHKNWNPSRRPVVTHVTLQEFLNK